MSTHTRADQFGDPSLTRCSYHKRGHVAVLTLSDVNLNGYTYRMFRDLDDGILKARFDPEVQVIVITGAGEHFCAGANIEMLEAADTASKYYFCLHANETLSRLESTPKLVIAAMNGHCVGGGFEIALACDLRIARRAGGLIGLPEVNLGVLPGTGGTQRLARLVGPSKAMAMMFEGKTMNSDAALEAGLVNTVLGDTEQREIKGKMRTVSTLDKAAFLDQVVEYANRYCTPRAAAMAVGHIKAAVQSGSELPLASGLAIERALQTNLFASADATEGLSAFVQKRRAEFKNS